MYWQFDELKGLLDDAPYEIIRLSVGENRLPKNTGITLRGLDDILDPIELLYVTSGLNDDRNNRRTSPTDPLLMLVVLADLTGVSESQDERIATFFADSPGNRVVLRGHLENILSSQLMTRGLVARHLHEMAVKSKSQKLIDAIRIIDPLLRAVLCHPFRVGGHPANLAVFSENRRVSASSPPPSATRKPAASAPATALVIADLVHGRPPRIDLDHFRIDRPPGDPEREEGAFRS